MRVYVSGSTTEKERVREVMHALRRCGHAITFDWTGSYLPWREEEESLIDGKRSRYGEAMASEQADAVNRCEALVLVSPPLDIPGRGAWAEFGAAAFAGKRVVILNDRDRLDSLFCRLPNVRHAKRVDRINAHLVA